MQVEGRSFCVRSLCWNMHTSVLYSKQTNCINDSNLLNITTIMDAHDQKGYEIPANQAKNNTMTFV